MLMPNIHRENYLLAVASKREMNLSDAEVAILRDVYMDSLPPSEQHTDMWARINAIKTAITNARKSRGVDIKV